MSPPRLITVTLEGPRAEAATRDLFSMGWFEAEWERRSDGPRAPSSLVSAQVVAIAGGSVTVADKLLGWWETWQKSEQAATGGRLSVVFENPSGARVTLASATRDALVDVLRVLYLPHR
jgi:hypothetical protein